MILKESKSANRIIFLDYLTDMKTVVAKTLIFNI